MTYYQKITGVCCTKTMPEFFTDLTVAEEYCETDQDCMSLYFPSVSKNEIFVCQKGTLVDSGEKLSSVKAKGTKYFLF